MGSKKIIFLIFLIFLGISIIIGVLITIYLFPDILSSVKEASAVTITGGSDGPTTIYISAKYNWKLVSIILLLLLIIDFIFLAIIRIIGYVKVKYIKLIYKVIIIFLLNLLLSILLFPGVVLWSIIMTAIIIIFIILESKLVKKKQ
jgi:Na+-transporting methylmalonyl-CoA/oxaloacetate decarboxylase beta subunit